MTTATYSAPNTTVFLEVPIDDVVPSPLNPRKHFADEPLQELAESIREHGILEPLVVKPLVPPPIERDLALEGFRRLGGHLADIEECRKRGTEIALKAVRAALAHGDGYQIDACAHVGPGWPAVREAIRAAATDNGLVAEVGFPEGYPNYRASVTVRPAFPPRYELIAGERRWRAAKLIGQATVPAVVRDGTDLDAAATMKLMLVENLQRADLDPIEEAQGYRALAALGMKQREIAESVHRSQPAVANAMRILDLPEDVQERIRTGELTASHGIALASYKVNSHVQEALAEKAAKENWTTKKLETFFGDLQSYLLPEGIRQYVYELRGDTESLWNWKLECRGNCPHDAFRASNWDYCGWCLRPACFEEKRTAAKRAQEEATAKKLQEAKTATGSAVLQTRELGYDGIDYHTIYSVTTLPEGCQTGCPKRVMALRGIETVEVCSDAKCWKRLETAATKARNKAGRNRAKALLVGLEKRIDGLEAVGSREMVILAALAMSDYRHVGRLLQDTLARHGIDGRRAAAIAGEDWDHAKGKRVNWNRYDVLAECSMLDLAKIILEVSLRSESKALSENPGWSEATPIADWYLADRPPVITTAPTTAEICPTAGLPCDPATCVQDCPSAAEAQGEEGVA